MAEFLHPEILIVAGNLNFKPDGNEHGMKWSKVYSGADFSDSVQLLLSKQTLITTDNQKPDYDV